MVEVRLEKVSKVFGRVRAVDNVTVTFPESRFSVMLGPSGSGKSTTLYLVAGIYRPTSGSIYFGDRDVTNLPPKDRNVGLVFQNYALYPHMSVYENIAFPLRLQKLDENTIAAKVNEVAKLLRIEELLDRYPSQLSGGQQQRVALARALAKEPSVLLLDEPLSNLDALLRLTIRAELKKLQQKLGITAIHVTHDQAEALSMADIIIVMDQGRIEQVGTPYEVYYKPRSLFVAGFIGSPPANILSGRIERIKDTIVVEVAGSKFEPSEEHLVVLQESSLEDIVIAFRPEHVLLVDEPIGRNLNIEAEVYVIEPLGKETIVTLVVAGNLMIKAVASPDYSLRSGERIYVSVPRNKVMLFDPATGLNILHVAREEELI